MSPQNSLLKRASVPLLAVTAAILCIPAHAATASLDEHDTNGPSGIRERIKCTMTGDSRWKVAIYKASNNIYATSQTNDTFEVWGPGDYYRPSQPYYYVLDVPAGGTYNSSGECDGLEYDGKPWQAFTSTFSVTPI